MTHESPPTILPPFLRRSPFLRRLEAAATVGHIVRSGGRYLSLPLEHRRPEDVFHPRMSMADNRYLAEVMERLLGPRSARHTLPLPPTRRGRDWRKPDWWAGVIHRRKNARA